MSEITTLSDLTTHYQCYKIEAGYFGGSYEEVIEYCKYAIKNENEYLQYCDIEEISIGEEYSLVYVLNDSIYKTQEKHPHLFL